MFVRGFFWQLSSHNNAGVDLLTSVAQMEVVIA